jgi:hypothetical protein
VTTRPRWACRTRLAVIVTVGALASGLLLPAAAGADAAATGSGLGPPNTWVGTGQMTAARAGQTATLLPSGKVLIAGGGTATAELYNPASRTFSATGRMPVAVTHATATLLPDGKVLVAGGAQGNHQVASAELYNPGTGTWSATAPMSVARSGQTATLLPDGKVLVAGGGCNPGKHACTAESTVDPSLNSAELYSPGTGKWSPTGSMAVGREFATATLLKTGKVLVAGGLVQCTDGFCSDTRTAELYNPAAGTWSRTGSMHDAREQHSATLLHGGEVLVAGGLSQGGAGGVVVRYSSAELYHPGTGTWTRTAPMAARHAGQTATLLRSGWVLVAGGGTSVAEIYEPKLAIWVSPGAMSTVRTGAAAVLLPRGNVLVTGGDGPDGQPQASAEQFVTGRGPLVMIKPRSIGFGGQLVGTASGTRAYQVINVGSASLVSTGVAVTGANPGDFRVSTDCGGVPLSPGLACTVRVRFAPTNRGLRTATAALSDNAPLSPQGAAVSGYGGGPNAWVPVGSMTSARENFAATLLPGGKVLMAGGQTATNRPLASAELYNPAKRSFSATGPLHDARAYPAATLLPDGRVLITGGLGSKLAALSSAELYNPATGKWASTTPAKAAGYAETSTLLRSGKVLVTGFVGSAASTGEIYDPATATWTSTGPMPAAQAFGAATLLPNGQVLLAGGGSAAAELYNPAKNTWKATGSLITARQGATAALLPDGDVLLTGGTPPGEGNALADAELYNPATGTWAATGPMNDARDGGTATLLTNGTVLASGGCTGGCGDQPALSSAEFYQNGIWFPVGSMTQPRVFQTATLLPDGSVLVAGGGSSAQSAATSTAELFTSAMISVRPGSGRAGAKVTLSGTGFYSRETVSLLWNGTTSLGRARTSRSGSFTTKITVPKVAASTYQISAQGDRSSGTATTSFTVTG